MCGIVGYVGKRNAQPVLLNSLEKLEYRGYDSCGIALAEPGMAVYKDAIRVSELTSSLPELDGNRGIGHTRWATHGSPCKANSHPHVDCTGRIALVHNGVVTNYQAVREKLILEGHHFNSETDTEVIVHLIEKYYHGDLQQAVNLALQNIEGSYAIIVMSEGKSELVAARKDSPLILGIGDRENFIASDVPAILDYTNRVIYLEDGDTCVITPFEINICNNGQSAAREEKKILWTADQAKKGGYQHFMLKEIHEQPKVIRDMVSEYLSETGQGFPAIYLKENLKGIILACGTSFYAGLVGRYIIEALTGVPIRVEVASEFNYLNRYPSADLGIGLTQSGETADTLKAMKRLKEFGSRLVAITNVLGSSASKTADQTLYLRAGPEMSVAATKTFIAQLIALYWIALTSADPENWKRDDKVGTLRRLPGDIQEILDKKDMIISAGEALANHDNIFYIGRGINYPIALEGALKMKEVAYIHSEAFAAGEIKHGPFALLNQDTPVVAIVADDSTREPMLTSIKEIKARRAPVYAIASEGDDQIADLADIVLSVPGTDPLFSPFVNTAVVQLLSYYAAKKRGCSIDFPRNLAKSVTVE